MSLMLEWEYIKFFDTKQNSVAHQFVLILTAGIFYSYVLTSLEKINNNLV